MNRRVSLGALTTSSLLLVLALVPACKKSGRSGARGSASSIQSNPAPEGEVTETPSGKLRIYALRSGLFRVWMMDKGGAVIGTDRARVRLKLDSPGYAEITLEPHGNYFQGKGPEIPDEHADALVTTELGGNTETVRIRLHMESGETEHHHDRDER